MGYIIMGIIGIIGGLSGYLVLMGTNSSEALVIVSIGFVIYGIIKVVSNNNDNKPYYKESGTPQKKESATPQRKESATPQRKTILEKNYCPTCNKIIENSTKGTCLDCGTTLTTIE